MSTSYSTRNLPSSFLSHTGFLIACTSHFKPPKRLTALIFLWQRKSLCSHTRDHPPITRSQFSFPRVHESPAIKTVQEIHVTVRITYTSTPQQHTLKPTASSFSPGQLENEHVQEGGDRDLPLECLQFPNNHRFTKRFWHQSKYFFTLADRQNDYLNTLVFIRGTIPSTSILVFYIPHRWI